MGDTFFLFSRNTRKLIKIDAKNYTKKEETLDLIDENFVRGVWSNNKILMFYENGKNGLVYDANTDEKKAIELKGIDCLNLCLTDRK